MPTLEPGTAFANRFDIERAAGVGGMGTVYRARDRYTGEWVALKLMHAEGGSLQGSERFDREARLLLELRHPGIVSYVAHGQTPDGRRFLAMEWLDGHDLGVRLKEGPLPIGQAVLLLRRVAEAIGVAHRQGVVHRDLKPSNLFLVGGECGGVKVLDFGVARRVAASQPMTRTGLLVGTPDYMAPEQARGERDLGPAADMFSLGCILYECLTGQPPFYAEHVAAVLTRILFEEPPPVEDRRPGVPAPLAALLGRMLAKHPDRRLADARELGAALAALGDFSEPSLAPTIEIPSSAPSSFAAREQGLLCMIIASARPTGAGDTTLLEEERIAGADWHRTLTSTLRALGVQADFLVDGSLVVTVPATGSATDQAVHAARVALLVKERWP
jgi:eukaryotic-like serine/threonine-protein kinase